MMALMHTEVPGHSGQRNDWLHYGGVMVRQDLNRYAGLHAYVVITGLPYTDS